MTKKIQTILGPVPIDSLGLLLPHEHLFTDLRGPIVPDYAQASPDDVASVVEPYLAEASSAGVTAMVECSTVGVGRNLAVLQCLAEITPIHIIAPTGVYKEAFTPASLRDTSVERLAELWTQELLSGIEGTTIRAGFIKLAVSDDGLTDLEIRNLKAAAKASAASEAVIASHTVGGEAAMLELDILENEGLDLERFIWVHAQAENDLSIQIEAARRGAYLEIDSIGGTWQSQTQLLENVLGVIEAGYIDNLLLSHDAGWYNPARLDGMPEEGFRSYTVLMTEFFPALREYGVTEEQISRITIDNPARAFAFNSFAYPGCSPS
ncbi:MAG: esterase [Anaerolineales bacterium]|nr:esterase [Anaerolineales bacterium]